MSEGTAFASLLIASIGPLYLILKRQYELKDVDLRERQRIARELMDACNLWSTLLERTFDNAVELLAAKGPAHAVAEIRRQEDDVNRLDYHALQDENGVLAALRADKRFVDFADACAAFYGNAISVKALARGSFEEQGNRFSLETDGIRTVSRLWKQSIDQSLENVRSEFRKLQGARN